MKRSNWKTLFAAAAMLILILDGKTALEGAAAGVELCVRSLIPALFPFLVLSAVLTGCLTGQTPGLLRPVGRLCRIPAGAESLFLVGLLGGYPVGAKCVAQAYRNGSLTKENARRMLGFCSNAGPSFLFGIIGSMFSDGKIPWILWGIHIAGALAAGVLLPGGSFDCVRIPKTSVSFQSALESGLRTMGLICGWVLLFRMAVSFLQRWIFSFLPQHWRVLSVGFLELSNGCILLNTVEPEGLRFLLASVMLSLGGVCVTLQTAGVASGLPLMYYVPGKLIQCGVSLIFGMVCQGFFPQAQRVVVSCSLWVSAVAVLALGLLFTAKTKKRGSNPAPVGV